VIGGARILGRGRDRQRGGPGDDLHGQVVLVTGGSRGLGYLMAREFAREGCRVAICARDEQELEKARAGLEGEVSGAKVFVAPCDMAKRDEVERLIEAVETNVGPIDILVNNAAIITVGPLENMSIEDFEESMGVAFWGNLYAVFAALPGMRARRYGRIVNITSVGGKVSVPHLLPYTAAKFAAVGLSEGLRAELAGTGVTVTTIAPGLIRTGSVFNTMVKGRREEEFAWFSLGDSLPFISMSAERAARQIVAAAKRGDAERILSVPAVLLSGFHGVFPGLTADILGLVNRFLLPAPSDDKGKDSSMDVHEAMDASLLDRFITLSRTAARRFNQYPGPTDSKPETSVAQ